MNDGSNSNYDTIFKEVARYAHIISYLENKGKGYALKTGLKYIQANYTAQTVITMDSDGQHRLDDALNIATYVKENTIVLGSRKVNKNTPLRSTIGNTITRGVYQLITHEPVYDTQTGLRSFSTSLIPFLLSIEGDRFEYEMNVLLACPSKNIEIKEIPITSIYFENNKHSHFHTIKDSLLVYQKIIKFGGSSFLCFLLDYFLCLSIFTFTKNTIVANIGARIISATTNYKLNKYFVFKSQNKGFIKYVLLASGILLLNTALLYFFVNIMGINIYISKIVVEIVLFIMSFLIQNKFIFQGRRQNG